MANVYVRSGAAGAGTGADWANAFTTLAAAYTAKAAGDDFWVSEDHAETQSTAMTHANPGTAASPTRTICVNHSGSVPPVSADLRASATISTTSNASITINGACGYVYGITFSAGNSTGSPSIAFGGSTDSNITFDACAFKIASSGSTGRIQVTGALNNSGQRTTWLNCTVSFAAVGQTINLGGGGRFVWKNAASALAGTVPTSLFASNANTGQGGIAILDGVDLSAAGSGKTIVAAMAAAHTFQLLNCKLGASVTVAGTPTSPGGPTVDLVISDSGATGYRQERYRYEGTLTTETTIVKTSAAGASDGTQAISWKIVTTANAKRLDPFEAFQGAVWLDTTGSKTFTFEVVNDGTTLKDIDIWAEVEYLGSSATPVSSKATSYPADELNTGTNLTTSTETWTTTGLASPTKQHFTVTLNNQTKGWARFTIKVGKASQTLYVDPYPVVT